MNCTVRVQMSFTRLVSLLPIVNILYAIRVFAHPRYHSLIFQRIHFVCYCWINLSTLGFRAIKIYSHDTKNALIYLGTITILSVLFYYVFKLRTSIGRLPDEDLSEFFVTTLFKGGFKMLASTLFVLFRSLKCIIENSDIIEGSGIEYCRASTQCATWISSYHFILWALQLVRRSIRQEVRCSDS